MSGNETPLPDEPPTLADKEVAMSWESFKAGGPARCPVDTGPLALSVDGASKCYRFVCTKCGVSSKWFGTATGGITIRGQLVRSGAAIDK